MSNQTEITRADQCTQPFSLICTGCDGGMEHGAPEEAIAAGWTGIIEAFDLESANYCGECPECEEEANQ